MRRSTKCSVFLPFALALAAACGDAANDSSRAAELGSRPAADTATAGALLRGIRSALGDSSALPTEPGSVTFERVAGFIRANAGSESPRGPRAELWLPADASGDARLGDRDSGVELRFHLLATHRSAALVGDGFVAYPGALGDGKSDDGSLVHRPNAEGTEDYVFFSRRPERESLRYRLELGAKVAGLRFVANTLEFLDRNGVPRLRLAAPYVVSAGERPRREARLRVEGCAYDASTRDPRGRGITPPGASSCELELSWWGAGVTYPALVDPAWSTTGLLNKARSAPLVLLASGKVLAVGGATLLSADSTCEIYDPATETWAITAPLSVARMSHALLRLADGRVLAVGNAFSPGNNTAEVYDPLASNPAWTALPNLTYGRSTASAVLLSDGRALVAGGSSAPAAEIFDPTTTSWSLTGPNLAQRTNAALTKLGDGRVILAGGAINSTATATSEIYTPGTNTWTSAGSMSVARAIASSILVGGSVYVVGSSSSKNVDAFDGNTWSLGPTLNIAASSNNRLMLLSNGVPFYFDGTFYELFDTAAQRWWMLRPSPGPAALMATPLADGRALFAGATGFPAIAASYLFDPSAPDAFTGGQCQAAAWCKGGSCANGVCCDAACGGCMACTQLYTAQPNGHCAPALAGKDPNAQCIDSGSPACGLDGFCDGAGACESYPAGTGCKGSLCTSAADCASNYCVDGVCCNSACPGLCNACSATLKGQGVDGVCGPIANGLDPQNECGTVGSGVCAGSGVCDGAGACRAPTAGAACGTSSCSGLDAQNNAPTCNVAGSCTDNGISSCHPYVCKGSACLTSCQTAADCAQNTQCIGGTCLTPKANGLPCGSPSECVSGLCVEGVCCDSLCDGTCDSCLAANKSGGSTGVCGPRKLGASCGAITCASSTTIEFKTCNGLGSCVTTQTACTPYVCTAAGCASSCTGSSGCVAPYVCVAGACVVQEAGPPDAATDSGSPDAALDASPDAPPDASPDAALDASPDAALDAAPDAALDAAPDAAIDSAIDSGVDAANDAGGEEPIVEAGDDAAADDAGKHPGGPLETTDDGGCGCRTHRGERARGSWLSLLALVLVTRRRGRTRAVT